MKGGKDGVLEVIFMKEILKSWEIFGWIKLYVKKIMIDVGI